MSSEIERGFARSVPEHMTRAQSSSVCDAIIDRPKYWEIHGPCKRRWNTGPDAYDECEGAPISAYAELLAQGRLDEHGVRLVSKIVREGLRRFPSLRETNEPEDVIQDFFVDRITSLTALLMAEATGDDSFGKLVRRTVQNWLIDRARATGTGPLRRSIEKVLAESPEFERVPSGFEGAGRWRLADTAGEPWGGDTGGLVAVAWAVPNVRVPRWSSSSRRPPVADRASMVAIALAVLESTGGSLEIAQLVHVFADRFAAALDPIVVPLDTDSDRDGDDEGSADVPSGQAGPEDLVIADSVAVDIAVSAAEIVGRLTDSERAIVPMLHDSAAVQLRLGLARSQSAQIARTVKLKIRALAGTASDREEIVREVVALCGGVAP